MSDITEFKPRDIAGIEKDILHNDYDFVGVISGGEGFGKSTLCKIINKLACIKSAKSYNLKRDTLFYPTMEEVDRIYQPENSLQSKQWDEAIRLLYKLDWASKRAKVIIKDFAVNRQLNIGTWLCIPRMKDLNENFRNWRVDWWGYVLERGVCVWFAKDWSPFARDSWHWDENERIVRKAQRKRTPNVTGMIHILSKTLGFQGVTYWDKFTDTDEEWKEYLRLKALKKTSIMDKYESKNKIKELAKRQLDLGKSYKEVMGLYDIKESTLYNWFPHSNSTARLHNIDKQAPGVFPPKEQPIREIRKGEQQGG